MGIGWYPIDIHRAGADDVGLSCRTHPFQIPLGALLPVRVDNLIAAAKNIGTTHLTNGCFRLHPVEWNIGESAGTLAAFALQHDATPAEVRRTRLIEFQRSLLDVGVPLAWAIDVPIGHPAFVAVQALGVASEPAFGLRFTPDAPIDATTWHAWGG
ncbi:MAG: FAD-dependent oxidoreductase, partial [Caldimonas sp.]